MKARKVEAGTGDFADDAFARSVIAWQKQSGRHDLPWQNTRDAYRIWLSEIMLQQTQVAAVISYYQRFLLRFPDIHSLAMAPVDDVMAHWSGLGYYTRARNLHKCAQTIVATYAGVFPADPALLSDLPGIGRSTAAAISAFAYAGRAAIMDGNVKRVFARVFGIEAYPGEKAVETALWQRAEALLPEQDIASYTQGLMDLGATLCSRGKPDCSACPLRPRCVAFASGRTKDLPVRKPKKAIPEKHTSMLLVTDRDQVLLEKRPDIGIWGGLYSLPELFGQTGNELALDQVALAQKLAPFGVVATCQRLPAFSHAFTHFKLHIAPYHIGLARRLEIAGQLNHVWLPSEELADAALPAPVKKLLLRVLRKG